MKSVKILPHQSEFNFKIKSIPRKVLYIYILRNSFFRDISIYTRSPPLQSLLQQIFHFASAYHVSTPRKNTHATKKYIISKAVRQKRFFVHLSLSRSCLNRQNQTDTSVSFPIQRIRTLLREPRGCPLATESFFDTQLNARREAPFNYIYPVKFVIDTSSWRRCASLSPSNEFYIKIDLSLSLARARAFASLECFMRRINSWHLFDAVSANLQLSGKFVSTSLPRFPPSSLLFRRGTLTRTHIYTYKAAYCSPFILGSYLFLLHLRSTLTALWLATTLQCVCAAGRFFRAANNAARACDNFDDFRYFNSLAEIQILRVPVHHGF